MRGLSLFAASGDHSSSLCAGLSPSRPLLLWSTGSRRAGSVSVAHGPSCSAARGIFPDQGSNPCPLHWQADSQPLRHQGSPKTTQILSYSPGGQNLRWVSQAMVKALAELYSFQRFWGRTCVFAFPTPRGPCILGWRPLPPSQSQRPITFQLLFTAASDFAPLTLPPPSFPYKDPCDDIGSSRTTLDHLPTSRPLTSSHLQSPFCQVR